MNTGNETPNIELKRAHAQAIVTASQQAMDAAMVAYNSSKYNRDMAQHWLDLMDGVGQNNEEPGVAPQMPAAANGAQAQQIPADVVDPIPVIKKQEEQDDEVVEQPAKVTGTTGKPVEKLPRRSQRLAEKKASTM